MMVSVVIPTYKKEKYISQTIKSVLQSTFRDFELIVVNDGSPDSTEEIVKKWQEKDSRIKYVFQENSGVCVARNKGIEMAKGKYILPVDSDDLIGREYLQKAVDTFESNPGLTIVYSKSAKFSDSSFFVLPWFLGLFEFSKFLGMNTIHSGSFFKKSDFDKTNGYDEKMSHGIEDWEFWIELLSKNSGKVLQLDYYGYYYRTAVTNSRHATYNSDQTKLKITLEYIYNKHKELYLKYYGDMPFDKIAQICYYQYKVERLEFLVKLFHPKNAFKMLMDFIKMQRKK